MKQRPILSTVLALIIVGLIALVPPAGANVASQIEASDDDVSAMADTYLSFAGSVFVPESSATQFETDAVGGVWLTGSTNPYMHAPLILPDGAQIYGFRLYYYDDSAGLVRARLIRNMDPSPGSRNSLITIDSSDGGYGSLYDSTGGPPIVVDNARYNYEIEVYFSTASPNLNLMRIRVYYNSP